MPVDTKKMREIFEEDAAKGRIEYLEKCAIQYDMWINHYRKILFGDPDGGLPIGILTIEIEEEKND